MKAGESAAATRWYNGLERAAALLAPENKKARTPLRHLLYGKRAHAYRVIYEIDERNKLVRILTIRHGAMQPAEFLD